MAANFSVTFSVIVPILLVFQFPQGSSANTRLLNTNSQNPYWRSQKSEGEDTVTVQAGPSYNGGVVQSSANCPEPFYGLPFLYFPATSRCYLAGVKGPCPENMRIFPQKGTPFGYCDCNCDAYIQDKVHAPRSFCTGKTEAGEVRSLAYVGKWGSCQPLLQQTGCATGFWLAFGNDPKSSPFCEQAVCPLSPYDVSFYDPSEGKCGTLGESCGEGGMKGTYQFLDNDWIPQCVPREERRRLRRNNDDDGSRFQGAAVKGTNCPAGFIFSSRLNSCVRRGNSGGGRG